MHLDKARSLALFAVTLGAAACISDPNAGEAAPMCEETSDCRSGEICDEGICYGDPPVAALAGILVPSGGTVSSLVPTEIPELLISPDGWIDGLVFAAPVSIDGKVTLVCSEVTTELDLACGSSAPINASIRVERASAFAGGPRFSQTFNTRPSVEDGSPVFTLLLPATHPDPNGETRPYQVTITPLEGQNSGSGPTPAQVVPPRIEVDFAALSSGQIEWKLGEPSTTKWISGCVTSSAGGVPAYAKGLPVAGYAPDPGTGDLVLVSSRGRTDNSGCYSLRVPAALSSINLRFEPDGGVPAPTIEIIDEPIDGAAVAADGCFGGSPSATVCLGDLVGPNLTNFEEITLPITAQASEGGSAPVAGAEVRMVAALVVPVDLDDPTRSSRTSASLDIRTTSSANTNPGQLGQATAMAPVNLTYAVSVVPAPDSIFAARIAEERFFVQGGVQEAIFLGRRVSVSGQILDVEGNPIGNAIVEATPSIAFKFSQPGAVRAIIGSLLTSTTTRDDGTFFFYLEGPLNAGGQTIGAEVEYDLAITPPFLAGPPTRIRGITPGAGAELGTIALPEAAFARGLITDPSGAPAASVELHIWEPSEADPCASFATRAGECPAAATRITARLADENGIVRVVLPNP